MKKIEEILEGACQLCAPVEKLLIKLVGLVTLFLIALRLIQTHP